jgi:hypothetical protein
VRYNSKAVASNQRAQRAQALVDYSVILVVAAALVVLGLLVMGSQIRDVLHWTAKTLQVG